MLKQGLKTLGQSLLIITGVGYGVVKALDAFTVAPEPVQSVPVPSVLPEATLQRLDGLEARLIRMEKSLQALATPVVHPVESHPVEPQPAADFVTRAELTAAMRKLSGRLETDIENRFEVQDRSVQSLRTMINRTDELLEQVLESIESNSVPA